MAHNNVCYGRLYFVAVKHRPHKGPGGSWVYPRSTDVLEEVGLQTMEHYVRQRRQTIVAWVVDRPLFAACQEGKRKRGTPQHLWWWEQEMSLDEVSLPSDASSDDSISSADSATGGGATGG